MKGLRQKKLLYVLGCVVAGLAVAVCAYRVRFLELPPARAAMPPKAGQQHASANSEDVEVETVAPTAGGIARKTIQPGSMHSFQSADLYAKISGYLKQQFVDIGSVVKRGDLLAELDIPELVQQLERDKAQLRQTQAEVKQAESSIASMQAEQAASEAYVAETEANVKRYESERQLREKQYRRIKGLHELDSVEASLVDEQLDQLQAAQSAELSARQTVLTARQQVLAAEARVHRAEADAELAKAKVDVAQADVAKTQVLLDYTRIRSPYDGVITRRSFHPGAFINSAERGEGVPLLSVDRTDLLRMVVLVPDRDVPYVQAGDIALIMLDALPEKKFDGRVARIAASEMTDSRAMRVEVDVPNTEGLIRDGMYGQVEIVLDEASAGVTIPSDCLAGDSSAKSARVFVVEQGHVRRREVQIGKDTGVRVEVTSGLSTTDQVVLRPPVTLADGAAVRAVPAASYTSAPRH